MSSSSELSLDEIYKNAKDFSEAHKNDKKENAESQTFLNEFFDVFGLDRKIVAEFERTPDNDPKRMDLFWPKNLLIEMKSLGENLDEAMEQALDYYKELKIDEIPRYILACDFQNWYLLDKKENTDHFFQLSELADNLGLFGFITGRQKRTQTDPVNIQASEMLGKIFDSLKASGYPSHDVEYFLTRLVFCLFADDTGIFGDYGKFQTYIKEQTDENGSDLGVYLARLFNVLNQHNDDRSKFLDSKTRSFPYINGKLFEKKIDFPEFDSKMRQLLIDCGQYDWSKVSPAIFGNMFQTVMDQVARSQLGAHYTSEENILKVIRPLFLDKLNEEFDEINEIKDDSKIDRFIQFQDKLANLKFLDPACGSGNFLVIAYREIRRIEHRVIMKIHGYTGKRTDTDELSKVDVDQFYGIELIEFSARIAETALWMMDHMMNVELSKRYGFPFRRIPIKKHPHIVWRDSLEFDWNDLIPSSECSYVFGNPPFYGANQMTPEQKIQMNEKLGFENLAKLDYVCAWFIKASQFVNDSASIGFVSTNSITQGEQVDILWSILLDKLKMNIIFAYSSFRWDSETSKKAQVIVVIIGLSKLNSEPKKIFNEKETNPKYISPYLIGTEHHMPHVKKVSKPLNRLPKIKDGAVRLDDGNYTFTTDEMNKFLHEEPKAKKWFRPFLNADNWISGDKLWVLFLRNIKPNEIKESPKIMERIEAVKNFRTLSKRKQTKILADRPTEFAWGAVPTKPFLIIPRTTTERRDYVPIDYLKPPIIPSNQLMVIEDHKIEIFGILTSKMHMVWLRLVGGKLKSDSRYSSTLVYNTFPTPANLEKLKKQAQKILDARDKYPDSTLEHLYDPRSMPYDLKKAHNELDKAVDRLYRKEPFDSDQERMEFLLTKYGEMTKVNTLDN